MAVHYRLYQNKDAKSPRFNKWFGRAVVMGKTSTSEIAAKVESRCTATKADIRAVISALVVVMRDELQNGKRVVLDEFGSFKIGLRTKMADKVDDFDPVKNVKRLNVVFKPEVHIDRRQKTRQVSLLDGCTVAPLPVNEVIGEKEQAKRAAATQQGD